MTEDPFDLVAFAAHECRVALAAIDRLGDAMPADQEWANRSGVVAWMDLQTVRLAVAEAEHALRMHAEGWTPAR